MILVLKNDVTTDQRAHIRGVLFNQGCVVREMNDAGHNVIGALGKSDLDTAMLEALPGVAKVVAIETPFKLVSRQWHPEDSVVQVGNVAVGGRRIVVVAGPCAIESRDQALTIARAVRRYGAVMYRGGAFKPRTSPYSFQGMEEAGLKILAEVREATGMPVVTEMTSPSQADMMARYVDAVQVGARNMQNFELLKCVGRMGRPVILKRGLAATIKEWLMSAEYILSEGNDQVILCERGIRTFEPYTRNTLDLSAIPVLKQLTHLPVLIDPSHATGIREKVSPMARAAVAAGADALMIEVHHDPDHALSDGPQSLYPEQFAQLTRDIYVIAPVVGKQLDFSYLDKAAEERRPQAGNGGSARTAIMGEMGTFSHNACIHYFGDDMPVDAKPSYRAVFEAVKSGDARYGVIPLENSLTGSIHENYDLLLEYDLSIVAEVTLRIIHNLIGKPGTTLDQIRTVMAPAQAMEQCRQFLDQHDSWQRVSVNATGSAVKTISQSDGHAAAAIGSEESAKRFGMAVIESAIETNPRNYTRFAVIAVRPQSGGARNKSSLVFATGNQPGALADILKIFADNGVNLVKLESRPIHGKPWEYMFYADVEADAGDPSFGAVIDAVRGATEFLKVLGTY